MQGTRAANTATPTTRAFTLRHARRRPELIELEEREEEWVEELEALEPPSNRFAEPVIEPPARRSCTRESRLSSIEVIVNLFFPTKSGGSVVNWIHLYAVKVKP